MEFDECVEKLLEDNKESLQRLRFERAEWAVDNGFFPRKTLPTLSGFLHVTSLNLYRYLSGDASLLVSALLRVMGTVGAFPSLQEFWFPKKVDWSLLQDFPIGFESHEVGPDDWDPAEDFRDRISACFGNLKKIFICRIGSRPFRGSDELEDFQADYCFLSNDLFWRALLVVDPDTDRYSYVPALILAAFKSAVTNFPDYGEYSMAAVQPTLDAMTEYKFQLNECDSTGPILFSACFDLRNLAPRLVKLGAPVDQRFGPSGHTVFTYAASIFGSYDKGTTELTRPTHRIDSDVLRGLGATEELLVDCHGKSFIEYALEADTRQVQYVAGVLAAGFTIAPRLFETAGFLKALLGYRLGRELLRYHLSDLFAFLIEKHGAPLSLAIADWRRQMP